MALLFDAILAETASLNSNINCHCVFDGYRYPGKAETPDSCSFLNRTVHKRRDIDSVYDISDQDAWVHLPALPATYWLETFSRFH